MKQLLVLIFFILALIACTSKDNASQNDSGSADGATVFKKYCVLCHGVDGKLGLNGAKDITLSQLTKAERVILIKHGKNLMTPFEGILSEAEIEAVAAYTMTLK